jgi:hypothetical protein
MGPGPAGMACGPGTAVCAKLTEDSKLPMTKTDEKTKRKIEVIWVPDVSKLQFAKSMYPFIAVFVMNCKDQP